MTPAELMNNLGVNLGKLSSLIQLKSPSLWRSLLWPSSPKGPTFLILKLGKIMLSSLVICCEIPLTYGIYMWSTSPRVRHAISLAHVSVPLLPELEELQRDRTAAPLSKPATWDKASPSEGPGKSPEEAGVVLLVAIGVLNNWLHLEPCVPMA